MKNVIICDIDGTASDPTHRLHHIRLMKGSTVHVQGVQGVYDRPSEKYPDACWVHFPTAGTSLWDMSEVRFKKNWDAFFDGCSGDAPHADIRTILDHMLGVHFYIEVVYVSGRPERTRAATREWLSEHRFPFGEIHMRADGDYRPDDVVKEEILDRIGLTPAEVLCVLDDRDRVVAMWRRRGFRVLQVANGDF